MISVSIFLTDAQFFLRMCYTGQWFEPLNESEEKSVDIREKELELAEGLASCRRLLTAIGDETRQHIILEMIKMESCTGARVGEITKKTNLSRPAVSHHLQIMKESGIVKVRKEGTKNFYYFDPDMAAFERLVSTLQLAMELTKQLPDRSGNNE